MLGKIIILFFLILNSTISAQINSSDKEEDYYTKGWPNGKYWESLKNQEKIDFLNGLETGIALCRNLSNNSSVFDDLLITGFRMSDFSSEIDLLYTQHANIRIAIAYAYSYVIKKMKGELPQELDNYLVWLRKTFNE